MTVVRTFDSHQGGVNSTRKVCQVMERCGGHGEMLKCLGRCDSCQKV